MKSFLVAALLVMTTTAHALTYSGVVTKTDGTKLEDSGVELNIILEYGPCVLYSETKTVDFTGKAGLFSVEVGSGTAVFAGNGKNVFAQKQYLCEDGSTATPTHVVLKATFTAGSATIDGGSFKVPQIAKAYQAEELNGIPSSGFVQATGTVSQNSVKTIVDLTSQIQTMLAGNSNLYAKMADIPVGANLSTKVDKAQNLADLPDVAEARANLGLSAVATLEHANCAPSQTLEFVSPSDSFGCQSIAITSSQVSGLGALALKNSVSDSDINDLAFSKLTGVPTTYTPSTHSHSASEVTGLGVLATRDDVGDSQITGVDYSKIANLPTSFTPSPHTHLAAEVTDLGPLATIAHLAIGDLPTNIPDSNLATISTAGKVNGSAITGSINVNGDITTGFASGTTTTLDMSTGNVQRVALSGACGTITLNNVKRGGQYTIIVRAATSPGICTLTANGAPLSGITSLSGAAVKTIPTNAAITANSDNIFSIMTTDDRMYVLYTFGF